MIDEKKLPYLLRRLLDASLASEHNPRFQQKDIVDALRHIGANDDKWLERIDWLKRMGYVRERTTILYEFTDLGRNIAESA